MIKKVINENDSDTSGLESDQGVRGGGRARSNLPHGTPAFPEQSWGSRSSPGRGSGKFRLILLHTNERLAGGARPDGLPLPGWPSY